LARTADSFHRGGISMSENLPEVYVAGYGAGKTFDLMKACAEVNGVFVTDNSDYAAAEAHRLGYDIIVVSWHEVLLSGGESPFVDGAEIFIDNPTGFLQRMTGGHITAIAIDGHPRRTSGQEARG